MRRVLGVGWLLVVVAGQAGLLAGLHALGTAGAALWVVGTGAAWWLAVSTALYATVRVAAAVRRLPDAVVTLAASVTTPAMRRVADRAVAGMLLGTSMLGGGGGGARGGGVTRARPAGSTAARGRSQAGAGTWERPPPAAGTIPPAPAVVAAPTISVPGRIPEFGAGGRWPAAVAPRVEPVPDAGEHANTNGEHAGRRLPASGRGATR